MQNQGGRRATQDCIWNKYCVRHCTVVPCPVEGKTSIGEGKKPIAGRAASPVHDLVRHPFHILDFPFTWVLVLAVGFAVPSPDVVVRVGWWHSEH